MKNSKGIIFFFVALLSTSIISGIFLFGNIITATASGIPVEVMDGKFFYSPSAVYSTLTLLGAEGRSEYLNFHILDYFFLLSYGGLMIACLKPFIPSKTKWVYIAVLPAGFDFIENTLIRIASFGFPKELSPLSTAISISTTLKWLAVILWAVVFFMTLGVHIVKKIKGSKKELR